MLPRARTSVSRPRTWVFRLILAVGGPICCLLLLEGGLRLAGFGYDLDFFIRDEKPGYYRSNPRFTSLYFPASFGLKPVNFRLPREKPAGSFRIFLLGESAAMGVPEPAFGVAPQLQAQLRAIRPGARIEVYNLGVTAINSHAILPLLREALDFQPDLLVIYLGNNEVVGPYGVPPFPRPLVRASVWIRATRTGQLMQRIADKLGRAAAAPDWRGMETFLHKTVPAADPRLARIHENFAANLDAMLAAARGARVKVVLSTVAVNVRDCAPFVSVPGEGAAAAHYRRAVELDQRGDPAGARREYFAALEGDALRFRADATENALIRAAARAAPETVKLVDAARELGADPAAAAPPPGRNLFLEHVHLTWEGNYALARLLAAAAADTLFGPASAPRPWLDPAACADAVGFTPIGRYAQLQSMDKLTARPPFTGQLRFAEDRALLARDIAAQAELLAAPGAVPAMATKISAALERDPQNQFLLHQAALAALQAGDRAGALRLLDRLAEAQPFSPEEAMLRTLALRGLGRAAEAEPVLRRAIAAEPYFFQTYNLLAQIWVEAGRTAEARAYFAGLVAQWPDSRLLRLTYAQVLASAADWPAAEAQWRAALRAAPDDEFALDPLWRRCIATGRTGEAVDLMLAAYAANPRSRANNGRLVEYAARSGDEGKVIEYLGALVESGPVPAAFYRDIVPRVRRAESREALRGILQRGRVVTGAAGDQDAVAEIDRLAVGW